MGILTAVVVVSVQAVFFGGMAITTLRMKYLWTPYMCILGSTLVTDDHVYTWLLGKLRVSSAALVSTYSSKLELMNFVGFLSLKQFTILIMLIYLCLLPCRNGLSDMLFVCW